MIRIINIKLVAGTLFFAGLFVLAFGLGLFLFKAKTAGSDIQIISATDSAKSSAEIVVDVGGAIKNPGVYKLPNDARVSDAVGAAGGLLADADHSRFNLALKLSDGQKVYIPGIGEASVGTLGQTQTETSTGLVNVNTASQSELDKLPGIGPVTAGKIINLRPYGSVSELLSKKAVSSSVYQKIKDLVTY